MQSLLASLRVALATILVCVVGYVLLVFAFAQVVDHDGAEGSLLRGPNGAVVGSRLIAQKFESPKYFWPRPSAVDYNASAAGGSNKSPTSSDLTDRATKLVGTYAATADEPIPADLVAASGSGLDPHISAEAARYQAERVAHARGLPVARVESLIDAQTVSPGGPLTPDRIVNVLELNLALDALR